MNKLISLAAIAVISFVSTGVLRAEVVASGMCGDNVSWTLDDKGEMILKGSGAMWYIEDYSYCDYISEIKTLVFEEGIADIADYSFYGCANTEKIVISNTVTTIGDWAFYNCPVVSEIISLNPVAPVFLDEETFAVDSDNLMWSVYNNAIVKIPSGSLGSYISTDNWRLFKNLQEVDFGGVESVENNMGHISVAAEGHYIVISGADEGETMMQVYDINGRQYYNGIAKTITVPTSGLYFVRIAGGTYKVSTGR